MDAHLPRHFSRPATRIVSACALAATAGCATGPDRNPADPLEPLNRATWRFNDTLDRTIAQPVARGYNRVVPRPIRTGIGNFFSNLGDVPVMLNDFAQLRFTDGMNDLMRIAVNSTLGLLGILDIATPAGIPKRDQDFGLTLAHYGVGSGPYLVLPIFGPSTFRDAAGFGVDQYGNPATYARPRVRNILWGVNFVSTRARYLNATNLLEQAALDKYLFVRDAYLQRRQSLVDAGKPETLPDYEGGKDKAKTGGDQGAEAAKPPASPAPEPAPEPPVRKE
jgi:phospholipid-binding lipoprotein MlaA